MAEKPDLTRFLPDSCLPTSWQHLLLRAVIGPEANRAGAWSEFCEICDLQRLDSASSSLISLVWTSIGEDGIKGADQNLIKGTWRHQWARRKQLLETIREILPRFGERALDVAFADETASALLDYPDGVLRPWIGINLAIRREDLSTTSSLLRELGWQQQSDLSDEVGSNEWNREGAPSIELRTSLFPEALPDEQLWSRMQTINMEGETAFVLPRIDRLLHLSYHGIRWMPSTPLLSFIDAAAITRLMNHDERKAIVVTAQEWRLTHGLRRLMKQLRDLGIAEANNILVDSWLGRAGLAERVETRLRDRRNGRVLSHGRDWFRARRLRRTGSL